MNTIILEMQLSRNLCLLKPWALFIIIFLVNANSVNSHDLHHGIHYLVSAPQHISSVNTIPKIDTSFMNGVNRGGGRTFFSYNRNNSLPRSNAFSINGGRLIRTGGDIVLGGIFPMHEQNINNPDYPCGMVKEEKGIQRLEAMMYALDKINNDDPDLLPNITLGSLIIDSCSSDTYALEQSMEFVRYYMNQDMSEYKCENGKPPMFVPHKPVAGVIGASFSVVSIMVANILRLFRIPQISYASTSTELSDKSRFEYFSRVVPPDNYQAQAIAEIVKSFDWRYTSTVAVEGEYGEKGIASFIQTANILGICVAVSEKVSRHSKPEDFDRIIERLYSKPQARVIVMFVDEDNVRFKEDLKTPGLKTLKARTLKCQDLEAELRYLFSETFNALAITVFTSGIFVNKLLQASIRANKTGHFIWLGSDSWGAKSHPVRDQEYAAVNAITVLPQRTNLEGFDVYFKSLRPRLNPEDCSQVHSNNPHPTDPKLQINCRNIWFNEFWSQHHKCSFEKDARVPCTGNESLTNYEQEGLVPFVVDAVYAMAEALHKTIKFHCGDTDFNRCGASGEQALAGADLLKAIRNVSFTGMQGTQIRFNEDGDAYGYYNIYQYQHHGGKYDYIKIGTWKESLDLQTDAFRWEHYDEQPKSICSEPCPIGHVHNHQDQCCWSCVKCREEFEFVENDTCISCDPGWAPNDKKNGCRKLRAEVIDWWSPWAYIPLIFSSIGILATSFTICVFIKFNHTPVIMASGRELCYVLLSGVCLCYAMTFVILARPTVNRCAFMRVGLGLCLSLCYSAIFVKTNRISRIFNCGVKAVSRPIYTSPISQIAICLCIVSVQLIGTIGWLLYENPDIKEIHPQPLTAVLTCKVSTFSLIMSLVYNMILILLCTLYAFKTRKIPENFNEAKYIGFTMYSTCIVWLAFLPIYFGTNNDYKIQVSSICMCLMISATVSLTCLFLPKVYLVLFQPYKNVRNATGVGVNRLAATDSNRPTNCMRFSGTRSQTFHSMTSSAITKSGSSSRLSHRVVNNANTSDDIPNSSVQTDHQLQNKMSTEVDEHETMEKANNEKTEVMVVTKTATTCDNGESSHNIESINDNNRTNQLCSTPSSSENGTINVQKNSNEGSVCNLNVISSINLESDIIEAVIDKYKHKST